MAGIYIHCEQLHAAPVAHVALSATKTFTPAADDEAPGHASPLQVLQDRKGTESWNKIIIYSHYTCSFNTVDFRVFESWSWERVLVSCNMRQSGEHPLRLAESTLHENIEGQPADAIVQT